ncbi:MAG: IPT/TIG domain-containing protein [Acidimicrobiales bacterium]
MRIIKLVGSVGAACVALVGMGSLSTSSLVSLPASAAAAASAAPWRAIQVPLPPNAASGSLSSSYINGISCPTPTSCVAVGSYVTTTELRESFVDTLSSGVWRSIEVQTPSGASTGGKYQQVALNGVSCPSTASCIAIGTYVNSSNVALPLIETLSDGSWKPSVGALPTGMYLASGYAFSGLSCPTATYCVAIGTYMSSNVAPKTSFPLIYTLSSGAWKMTSESAASYISSISCPSTTTCYVAGYSNSGGGIVIATTNGGSTWSTENIPAGVGGLSGISCPSAATCYVAGYSNSGGGIVIATTNGGSTWTTESIPPGGISGFTGIVCPSTTTCYVAGYSNSGGAQSSASIIATTNGGSTWTTESIPSGISGVGSFSCPSVTTCYAVGYSSSGGGVLLTNYVSPPVVRYVSPPFGSPSGGTTVTVTGTGFSSSSTVNFGTSPATNVSCTSTSCTAVSPAGTAGQAVNVTVTTSTLASYSTPADLFTYYGSGTGGSYAPLSPVRIVDTRCGTTSPPGFCANEHLPSQNSSLKTLTPNTPVTVSVGGIAGIPLTATAVAVNVTAVNPAGNGYISVYPAGGTVPSTSNLNFQKGATRANLVEVGLSSGGQIDVVSDTTTDVLIDVAGYYSSSSGTTYSALPSPVRIVDTRCGTTSPPGFCANEHLPSQNSSLKTLTPNTPVTVSVGGIAGIPLTATAAVVNLTAIDPHGGGYLSAYPAGETIPLISNVNFEAGTNVANRGVVMLSSSGEISLVSNTSVDVAVDVNGYLSSSGGSTYTPEALPIRICDTRSSSLDVNCSPVGSIGAGGSIAVNAESNTNVPSTATAVVVNVTAIAPTKNTFLTVYPTGTAKPSTSDINVPVSVVVPNLVIATLSSAGTFTIYNNSGTANVAVDVLGWYS